MGAEPIVIDPCQRHQHSIRAVAAISDVAASLIWGSQTVQQRHALLDDMFNPDKGWPSALQRVDRQRL